MTGRRRRPLALTVGLLLVALAAVVALRHYWVTAPTSSASVLAPTVRCEPPLIDALDEGDPGGSLRSPAERAARGAACDQASDRLVIAGLLLLGGGALLWTRRRALVDELV